MTTRSEALKHEERTAFLDRLSMMAHDMRMAETQFNLARERAKAPKDSLYGSDRQYHRTVAIEKAKVLRTARSIYRMELRRFFVKEGFSFGIPEFGIVCHSELER